MKIYLRIAVFVILAVVVLAIVYAVRQTSAPESAIIARERDRVYAGRDKARMEKDATYALGLQDKLRFLDYSQANAYNAENKPDEAIAILERLIRDEESKGQQEASRRSRSYLNEARYYEALEASFDTKHDEAGVKKAKERRLFLMARAAELEKQESVEEGKRVGSPKD